MQELGRRFKGVSEGGRGVGGSRLKSISVQTPICVPLAGRFKRWKVGVISTTSITCRLGDQRLKGELCM